MAKKILLTIAARGGSKGVKNKNIRMLHGKPLIAHTIHAALKWGKADRVVVSTDSAAIARAARKYGAEVPFLRPAAFARDSSPKWHALKHVLEQSEKFFNERYDLVIDLDVTAPIRSGQDIDVCLQKFLRFKPKTLFSVTLAHKNPYFNMVEETKNGRVRVSKKLRTSIVRRQDAPKVYAINGSIYVYSRNYLLKSKNPIATSDDSIIHVMDELSGIDIDREIDFKFVEFLIREGMVKF